MGNAMKPSLFLLFNHTLTPEQEHDARFSLGVDQIILMPSEISGLWSQIPPDLSKIEKYLTPMKTWLDALAQSGDFILIQGDFGACYQMVNHAFMKGYIPVYATTSRESVEISGKDGTIQTIRQFRHRMFRVYEN